MSGLLRDHGVIAFSPDGKVLAASQLDWSIRLWDLTENQPKERADFLAHKAGVGPLTFGPDGKTLFSGGGDHLVRSWDLTAVEPREKLKPEGPIGGLGGIAFSPDGAKLAVSDAEFVRIWDLSDPRETSRGSPRPRTRIDAGPTDSLAFSPSGKTLICGGELNTSPSIWDVIGLQPTLRGDLGAAFQGIRSMSFALDGETLAAGYNDHKVRVWDMRGRPSPRNRLVLDGDAAVAITARSLPKPPLTVVNRALANFVAVAWRRSLPTAASTWPSAARSTRSGSGSWPVSSPASGPSSRAMAGRSPRSPSRRMARSWPRGPTRGLSCGTFPARSPGRCIRPVTSSAYPPSDRSTSAWGSRPGIHARWETAHRGRPALRQGRATAVAAGDLRLRRRFGRSAARMGPLGAVLGDRPGAGRPPRGGRPAGWRRDHPPPARRAAPLKPAVGTVTTHCECVDSVPCQSSNLGLRQPESDATSAESHLRPKLAVPVRPTVSSTGLT